jgi:hypothetical protein
MTTASLSVVRTGSLLRGLAIQAASVYWIYRYEEARKTPRFGCRQGNRSLPLELQLLLPFFMASNNPRRGDTDAISSQLSAVGIGSFHPSQLDSRTQ